MHPQLNFALYNAINDVLTKFSEDGLWDNYIHQNLVKQMLQAAELVFDSAQEAQEYYKHETD